MFIKIFLGLAFGLLTTLSASAAEDRELVLSKIKITDLYVTIKERRNGLCRYEEGFGVQDGWCWTFEANVENSSLVPITVIVATCRIYFDESLVFDRSVVVYDSLYRVFVDSGANALGFLARPYPEGGGPIPVLPIPFQIERDQKPQKSTFSCDLTDYMG